MAPITAARTAPAIGPACAKACIIAREVAIVVCTMEFAFCHLACLCSNSAFCFSNSLFLSAVALSAARFRASPSSLVITPLSTKSSMRSFSSSPASSFFSFSSSICSMRASKADVTIEVIPLNSSPKACNIIEAFSVGSNFSHHLEREKSPVSANCFVNISMTL